MKILPPFMFNSFKLCKNTCLIRWLALHFLNGQSKTIKLKKNIRSCFLWVRIWLNDSRKLKKRQRENTKKTVKKCKKTTKTKLILSWKYLNCHRYRNSLKFHRRNTKNIFHTFSKQKHNSLTKRWDCSTFLPKILCHMQQNSWKLLKLF